MWGLGKSAHDVWSTLVSRSGLHSSQLEEFVEELVELPSSTLSKPGHVPHSQPSSSLDSSISSAKKSLVIWDANLGAPPFLSTNILANLLVLPCALHDRISDICQANADFKSYFRRYASSVVLEKLIVCSAASLESLDLSSLAARLMASDSPEKRTRFEKINNIDLILPETTAKAFRDAQRVFNKLAPLTHTAPSSMHVHPLSVLHLPLSNHFFQLIVDPNTYALGVSPSCLAPSPSPVQPLTRPPRTENRAKLHVEFDSLPSVTQERYVTLAKTLSRVGAELGVRLESWALGPASELLSQQLSQEVSMQDASATGEKVALILVDRSLDLLSPTVLGQKCLLDRLINAESIDILSKTVKMDSDGTEQRLQGLSSPNPLFDLAHASSRAAHDSIIAMLSENPRKALASCLRKLSELASEEALDIDFSISKAEDALKALDAVYDAWSGTSTGRSRLYQHRHLLLALDVACSLQDEMLLNADNHSHHHLSTIKHLLSTPGESVLEHINYYIEASKKLPITAVLRVVIALAMLGAFIRPYPSSSSSHSSASDANPSLDEKSLSAEEQKHLDAIVELLAARIASELSSDSNRPPWLANVDCSNIKTIQEKLRELFAYMRAEGPIEFDDFQTFQESQKAPCLVAQLVDRVFDPQKLDLRDLKQGSVSMGTLLKSGLSMISLRHQPRPNDRTTVILFVVGGITMAEVVQIQEAMAACQSKTNLIVGSSGIWSSLKLADLYCSGFAEV